MELRCRSRPEAPLIALGGITGLAVTYYFKKVPEQAKPVVSTAGSFSAISSLFGGPIVGGMMMVEGALGLGAKLLPGFVAAAVGYVLFIGFGNWGGLGSESLAYPTLPPYHGTHLYDLLIAIVVGVVAAGVISAVRHGAEQLMLEGPKRFGVPLLLLGVLAVGLAAQTAGWLGANPQDVLFSGQSGVPDLEGSPTTKIVLILLVAKAFGYAVSLGCGFRGGPILPGDLPRHRGRDVPGRLVRHLADRGRCRRRGGRDRGGDAAPVYAGSLRRATGRTERPRRGSRRRAGRRSRVADDAVHRPPPRRPARVAGARSSRAQPVPLGRVPPGPVLYQVRETELEKTVHRR